VGLGTAFGPGGIDAVALWSPIWLNGCSNGVSERYGLADNSTESNYTATTILWIANWRSSGHWCLNLAAAVLLPQGSTGPANLAVDWVEKNSLFFPINSLIRPN
jgi:hypothetical protein